MTTPISQCWNCKNKTTKKGCFAYGLDIPAEILTNEHDHKKPFPGDHGIRFEPITKK